MKKKEHITHGSAKSIKSALTRGKSRSDWAAVKAMAQTKVERLARSDDGALPKGWEDTAFTGMPARKKDVHIRLDTDIIDWFKNHGAGYQTRINAVLRSFVQSRR